MDSTPSDPADPLLQLPKLLAIAKAPATHWRYALTATRFLRALVRRDQPLRADISIYLAEQLVSDQPNQRTHSMLAYVPVSLSAC